MTYTYNRTDNSNIAFFRSDRHRMRLGLLALLTAGQFCSSNWL